MFSTRTVFINMRTTSDAALSMAAYLREVLAIEPSGLGTNWSVTTDSEEGAESPPLVTVSMAGPTLYSGPAHESLLTQPMTLTFVPQPALSSETAQDLAGRVQDFIYLAFRVGVGDGAPMRVPLLSFEGGEVFREQPGYLRILDLNSVSNYDKRDSARVTVVAELRTTWRRLGRIPRDGPAVARVTADFEGS